jgi:FAD/FMN-containing dehydrogenase
MNKIASYLQSHISGEVLASEGARNYFSTDASVLSVKPALITYPRTTSDIRKIARFSWQLAEKGHKLPITARGSGTDQSGAAIGSGIVMVFPAHMHRILELDTKQKLARVQPGVNYKSLLETMYTHGLFLPPYPASYTYSTIGGAIANNTAGEKSLKYGAMREWTSRIELVLANGEVIQTGRISRRELEKKKGLATMEGEIYRAVDGIIMDNQDVLTAYYNSIKVSKNSVGYALGDVKRRDGSFDLTPLVVGSQGTLGIVAEAIVHLAPHTPRTELVVATFESLDNALEATDQLATLTPAAIEMVDNNLLDFVTKQQGTSVLKTVFGPDAKTPAVMLFAEFDDVSERARSKKAKRAVKLLERLVVDMRRTTDHEEQERLWSIRHSAAAIVNYDSGGKSALPIIEDGIVPRVAFHNYIQAVYELFKKYGLEAAVWGHAGDANLHMQPFFDLRKTSDRQKALKLMDEYNKMVIKFGGSIAAEHNDGRIRAPYVAAQCGEEMAAIFKQVKDAFDPHGILNPGVKVGTTMSDLVNLLRNEYSIAHLADHLPRT